jgi:hypothetical protein
MPDNVMRNIYYVNYYYQLLLYTLKYVVEFMYDSRNVM